MRSPRAPFMIRSSALVFAAVLSAAVARPAVAQTGGPADVTLSWLQPSGSAPVSQFRVYAGTFPYQGSVLYAGLPVPDAQGVYSTTVQIVEIAQGIPMYVWLTAANASGESAPSNANLYPEGCDPAVDSDCDGIADDGAAGNVALLRGLVEGEAGSRAVEPEEPLERLGRVREHPDEVGSDAELRLHRIEKVPGGGGSGLGIDDLDAGHRIEASKVYAEARRRIKAVEDGQVR